MMSRYKSILITGASSGIGAALARYYAAPGVYLALCGRNRDRLAAIAAQCVQQGAQVDTAIIDVADRVTMKEWIEAVDKNHSLDLVIANAGISGGTGGVDHGEPDDQVRKIMDVNLTGVLNTINPALPLMIARGGGQIAIMSSLAGFFGWPGAPAYSASKAAVRIHGESLYGTLLGTGVGVSVVCPGFIDTPMTAVNDYFMPFMIDADRAAALTARGLEKRSVRIAFPLPTYLLVRMLGCLPPRLSAWLLSTLPQKSAMKSGL